MITEDAIIAQLNNENDHPLKVSYLLQYRNQWLTRGFEDGWNRCMADRKKSKAKLKASIIKEKDKLLDELHEEIYKIGNDKNNI